MPAGALLRFQEAVMDIEEKDYEAHIRRIKQIDGILRGPIETLVDVVIRG